MNLNFLKVTFSDEVTDHKEASSANNNEQKLLKTVREKDDKIRHLQEANDLYKNIFGELSEEAGLFELDQDVFS